MSDQTLTSIQARLNMAAHDLLDNLATIIEGAPRVRFCSTHGVATIADGAPYCYWAQVYDVVTESHTKATCLIKKARILIEEEE